MTISILILCLLLLIMVFVLYRGKQYHPPVAVVSTVKYATDFHVWLYHYMIVLRIDFLFLQIDGNKELYDQLRTVSFPNVILFYSESPVNELNVYDTIQVRQRDFVNHVIEQCYRYRIPYLLHIDDDELLVVSRRYRYSLHQWIRERTVCAKKKTIHSFSNIKFQNIEAVYPPRQYNCFQTSYFTPCHRQTCKSYANGKSMAILESGSSGQRVSCLGPHDFSGPTYRVPTDEIVLLHFDNCSYTSWLRKFTNLSNLNNSQLQNIPFPFYRESIQMIQQQTPPEQQYNYWHNHHTKDDVSPYFHLETRNFKLNNYYS